MEEKGDSGEQKEEKRVVVKGRVSGVCSNVVDGVSKRKEVKKRKEELQEKNYVINT